MEASGTVAPLALSEISLFMSYNSMYMVHLFQVVLTTKPGDGVFEVTVTHQLKENKMEVNKKDISRTNKYGNASHCVVNKEPFLRPYCYCKDVMKT